MAPDEAAYEEFVRACTPSLSRTAHLLTGDGHLAEDLLQHALIQVARHWERIRGHPEAYARRILATQNISWWRARRRRPEVALETWHDRPAPAPDRTLGVDILAALAQLTPRQRTVLVLRYAEDLTETQVADLLGIRPGTVKSIARQATARMRVIAPELDPALVEETR